MPLRVFAPSRTIPNVKTLRNNGIQMKVLIPEIARLPEDKHGSVRSQAAVAVLMELLKDENQWVCLAAAEALRDFGPDAKAAVPLLTELLAHKNALIRSRAAEVLGNIGRDAETAVGGARRVRKGTRQLGWAGFTRSVEEDHEE